MIQNYTRYKILQEFFDSPRKNFQMREISRITKISHPSVIVHLKALLKDRLILKEKKGIYPTFCSNRESELFKLYKRMNLLIRMQQIGLSDYIYNACMPDVILVFGSAAKGEDIEESDIDIFVQAPERKLNLEKYEKILRREIDVFFEEDINKLNSELKNNIINGTILKGYLKVF